MIDEIWKRDEIDSPCVKICVVHPAARICIGCHRTTAEISDWSRMTPDQRTTVMAELPDRESLLRAANARPSRRKKRGRPDGG